jgi:hypothetical protein
MRLLPPNKMGLASTIALHAPFICVNLFACRGCLDELPRPRVTMSYGSGLRVYFYCRRGESTPEDRLVADDVNREVVPGGGVGAAMPAV